MSLIVQKFGGSSLADGGRLLHAARIIRQAYDTGNDVVVVVSAQGETTDRLVQKAKELCLAPEPRELDALLSTGEQASAALTAIALASLGTPAVSLAAWQTPIRCEGAWGDARIVSVGHRRIERELAERRVVVCAGFQGVGASGGVMTLGRGGSDYTAVALAAELGAERCLIYTDVDGVYTADPRICPSARRLERVSYEDMYALAHAGARVLHDKCVSLAQERGVEPEVLACREDAAGTRVGPESAGDVTGVAGRVPEQGGYATVTLVGRAVPSLALEKKALLALDAAGIFVRGVDAGTRTLTLYVEREHFREALCTVHDAVFG